MNMLYLLAAAFALIGVLLIAGFVKHLRESAANQRRLERETTAHRERLNQELLERLKAQVEHRPRAYPIAAKPAPAKPPKTAQQNGVPAQSSASDAYAANPVPDFTEPSFPEPARTPDIAPSHAPHTSHSHDSGPAEACNASSFASDSGSSYSCDSSSSYDSSSSSCDSGSSSCGGGESP